LFFQSNGVETAFKSALNQVFPPQQMAGRYMYKRFFFCSFRKHNSSR